MSDPTPEQIRATVDAYVAAYKANDRDALLACFAENAEWTDPVGTPTHHGRDGVGAFWDTTRALADSIELRPVHVHVCGTEAALVMEIHTVVGGAGMVLDAVDVFSFDGDGRIASGKAYWELEKARPASA
jgi:steroid delta-isomerase